MTSHDVQLLIIDLALILVLARVLGAIARKIDQPPVVGEILAGILLGPTLFDGWITHKLFPAQLVPPLTSIADVGLVLFMFIVGYELDRTLIKGRERIAVRVSIGSIALPLAAGFGLGLWLAHRHQTDSFDRPIPTALFIGAAMSVTAFPVLARILTDRGMHRTRLGGLALASAAVGDVLAWVLLAIVVTISSDGSSEPQWHILLAPVYLAAMIFVVRPLLRRVAEHYRKISRLAPDLLAIVLAVLLVSAFATEWLGVHFIFGAFICGAVMPRADGSSDDAPVRLRESILERLEQLSVLLLLPVFFVVAGLTVNLSTIDGSGALELLGVLVVAIGGKLVGAYFGGRSTGMPGRQSGALAALMNTRGLTELVILKVGYDLKVLDEDLFTLMVLMALITTAMTGPLLRLVYPNRLVQRDVADAERAALGGENAYRVLVVVNSLENTDLVDTAIDLAAGRRPAQVVLARLVPHQKADRLEVGTGLGTELLVMTRTLAELHALAGRGAGRGVETPVHAKYSENELSVDLTRLITDLEPDLALLDAETEVAVHDFMPRIVRQQIAPPADATEVAVVQRSGGADESAALQVGAQLAQARELPLVLVGSRGERVAADLVRRGIAARGGELAERAIVVSSTEEPGAHLVARARPDDAADSIDDWAGALSADVPVTQEVSS